MELVAAAMNRFIRNMPARDYHADPCEVPSLTQSIANEMLTRSPWHAWRLHPKLGGKHRRPTTATDDGSLLHAALLGGDDSIAVVDVDNFRTKAAQELRDAAINAGKVVVKKHEYHAVMERAARIDRTLRREYGIELGSMQRELTAIWSQTTDDIGRESSPVVCRARLDAFDGQTIYDIKTMSDASISKAVRSAVNYGYHVQDAAYTAAVEHVEPRMAGRVRFVIIAIENETDAVYSLEFDGMFCELGRQRWQAAINAWHACLTSGKWPGYSDGGPVCLECPEWLKFSHDYELSALRGKVDCRG